MRTWAPVPTASSQTSTLPGHVIHCRCVNQSSRRFISYEIETSFFSIHYLPFLTILLLIGASQSRRLLHTLVRPTLVFLPGVVTQQGIRAPSTRDCWAGAIVSPAGTSCSGLRSPCVHPAQKNNLRVIVANCNSVASKSAELANVVDYTEPDILLLTEIKLDNKVLSSGFLPQGYTCAFRLDRNRSGGTGGGCKDVRCETTWASVILADNKKLVVEGILSSTK